MAKIKGSGKQMTERVFKRYSPDKYEQYLATFSEEQRRAYVRGTAIRWEEIETDEVNNALSKAANILYQQDPRPLFRYGIESAKYGFSFLYQVFFKFPSITNLFKKISTHWSQMMDTGQPSVEEIQKNNAVMVVRAFPDWPNYCREYFAGFFEGMMELNGAKNPRVVRKDNDPTAWRFELSWD